MIGARIAVLVNRPAKLGHRHQDDILHPIPHILAERGDARWPSDLLARSHRTVESIGPILGPTRVYKTSRPRLLRRIELKSQESHLWNRRWDRDIYFETLDFAEQRYPQVHSRR
jgi:hypothetical protein